MTKTLLAAALATTALATGATIAQQPAPKQRSAATQQPAFDRSTLHVQVILDHLGLLRG